MMQIGRPKIKHLSTTPIIIVAVFLWVFSLSGVATAFDFYAESAHGNRAYGVYRSSATCENWPGEECVTGSCAHCHDTFDPEICESDVNGLMLFAPNNPDSQTDNFCFECHQSESTVQQVTNYDYGATFGGGIANSTNIKDAFNFGLPNQASTTGSSHNLKKLRNWTNNKGLAPWVTAETNACVICHNPHVAQKNNNNPYDPSESAVSRLGDHGNVWGDDSTERMNIYTDKYQAPYWSGGTDYEPGNDPTYDGSNLPDFVNFCYGNCHERSINVSKTDHDRALFAINWESDGDQHGKRYTPSHVHEAWTQCGGLEAPYSADGNGNGDYVLSCTDCHEPHGSPNEWVLRTSVNGKDNINWAEQDGFLQFCTACHWLTPQHDSGTCGTCHYHGSWYDGGPIF
ncbi:MAG: hypothetical protein JRJ47_09580 [Deltaproteobacteria bacterium]|nr:hypothetical protein [Deltaproteobacteria bacterium]